MYGGGSRRKDTKSLSSILETNQIVINIERARNSISSMLIWRPGDKYQKKEASVWEMVRTGRGLLFFTTSLIELFNTVDYVHV